MTTTRRKCLNT